MDTKPLGQPSGPERRSKHRSWKVVAALVAERTMRLLFGAPLHDQQSVPENITVPDLLSPEHVLKLTTIREKFLAVYAWSDQVAEFPLGVWVADEGEAHEHTIPTLKEFDQQLKELEELLRTQASEVRIYDSAEITKRRQLELQQGGVGSQLSGTTVIVTEPWASIVPVGPERTGNARTKVIELVIQTTYDGVSTKAGILSPVRKAIFALPQKT